MSDNINRICIIGADHLANPVYTEILYLDFKTEKALLIGVGLTEEEINKVISICTTATNNRIENTAKLLMELHKYMLCDTELRSEALELKDRLKTHIEMAKKLLESDTVTEIMNKPTKKQVRYNQKQNYYRANHHSKNFRKK